jgi:ADP-heptose:LPS heptosyltransferase
VSLKTWERRGKRGLTRAAARALRARGEAGAIPDLRDLERILLIRQQNQLGDLLLSTPALRAVRARAPRARIDLIAAPQNVDAVRGNRRLDDVILYDKAALLRRPLEARRFADRLRSARYDLALVLSTVSFSYTGAWLAAVSGARRRAGRPGPGGAGRETAADVYHWCLPVPRDDVHQTLSNLDLVVPFGARETDGTPEIFPAAAEAERGRSALDEALPPGPGLRVLLHPGAGKKPNRWPAERFGEVGDALRAEGHAVAACSGPGEVGLLAAMDRAAGRPFPRLPALGFRELAAALAGADLVLVNDTGVLHLAAAAAPAVLALFGPTDPRLWCPATPRVRPLRAPGGDLRRLETAEVRRAAVAWAAARADGGEPPAWLPRAPGLLA